MSCLFLTEDDSESEKFELELNVTVIRMKVINIELTNCVILNL